MRLWILVLAALALTVNAESPKEVPRFNAVDLEGEPVMLDSLFSNGPVYLAFWAIWCKSCIRELDALSPIYEKHHEEGFELVAINEDGPRSIHRVKPMVRGKRWKFKVILDPEKELSRVFKIITLPTSFLINTDGTIIKARQGFKPGTEKIVEEELRQLLRENGKKKDLDEKKEPDN